MLVLGNLLLIRDANKIWIQDIVNGEGGSFPVSELTALVEKYFGENF